MATAERSLVILKPDAVQRGLVGEIISRYERRGLKIAAMKFEVVSSETAQKHYAEHEGKPFFSGLVEYITSAPSVLMVVEGPGAIGILRTVNGATNPAEANPGTVRADLALTIGRNLVHASDSAWSAQRELDIFFGGEDGVQDYKRTVDQWVIED